MTRRFENFFLEPEGVGRGSAVVREGDRWLFFRSPIQVFQANSAEEVSTLLDSVDQLGQWVVGFLAYEAAMDPAIRVHESSVPLAWFAVYGEPPRNFRELAPFSDEPSLRFAKSELTEGEYLERFDRVKAALAAGDSYQINLTYRNRYKTKQKGFDLFRAWCGVEPPPYACYIDGGEWEVVSLSPELFVKRDGGNVTMRPMKGTAQWKRGATSDAAAVEFLKGEKTKAENLMIVDMVRNDLGRIADIGTVRTPSLMDIEAYGDILQVTSTVTAETSVSNRELLQSIFPPASVTGAPKVASCNLIYELEVSARGVYCGAIGVWKPGGDLRLGVGIRTAFVQNGTVTYGVGGGIVWDSQAVDEYKETRLKLSPITRPTAQWSLIEAFHAEASPEVRERHLQRLSDSALEFGIPFEPDPFRSLRFDPKKGEKIRISLDRDGFTSITSGPSLLPKTGIRAHLASAPIDSHDPLYGIKTNGKPAYLEQKTLHREFDEVLFYNERGEATEFSSGNLLLRIGDRLITPPRDSGLLFGITVQQLVEERRVEEQRIRIEELLRHPELFIVNAVVGIRPVELFGA